MIMREEVKNAKAVFDLYLTRGRRPYSYGSEGAPGCWYPVVYWRTESGNTRQLVQLRPEMTEAEARSTALDLLVEAKRRYERQLDDQLKYLLWTDHDDQ